jgi:Protein of unknown function (DUF992)
LIVQFYLQLKQEITMRKILGTFAAIAVLSAMTIPSQAADRTKAGTLSCDISGGLGLIITSKKELTCMFTPSAAGPREVYSGSITKFGLDLGATTGGEMVWAVFAPSDRRFGALAGEYGGASAEATVGGGLGANVLVGGSDRTVALQPISVQGQTGLNLAVGVTGMRLHPAR